MIERYTLAEMGSLWTEENKFRTWLEVEIEASRAMARYRIIPQAAFKVIEKKANFDVDRINKIEQEVNHDVIAFLTSVAEFVGEEAKYIHFGMTSSDVLDTALSLTMKRAAGLIDKKIGEALREIKKLAMKFKMTPCIGRSHGIHAEPTTAGLKFAMWYTELSRAGKSFKAATEEIAVGKISGAVGNFANLDPRVEAAVCKKLGLKAAEVSTQVIQRDRHARFINALAILMSSLEKFATEVRSLQRTEIGEMAEGFAKGQKGSSAMPHKRNPITAERITGIARMLRGYAVSAMENIPLWHERDIAHSSVERVIIPDAVILTDYGLQKFIDLLKGLVINKKRMLENVFYYGGVCFSQRLLLKLTEPMGSREKAYATVQRIALKAVEGEEGFNELCQRDAEVGRFLSKKEIKSCFDVGYYSRHVDTIFKRVFHQ